MIKDISELTLNLSILGVQLNPNIFPISNHSNSAMKSSKMLFNSKF